jgi:hypothetical protein
MYYKNKIIILLITIILLLCFTETFYETFEADNRCMGLSAPKGTITCGNFRVEGQYCTPNPNDCYIDPITKEERCWCALNPCTSGCNIIDVPNTMTIKSPEDC